MSIIVDHFSTFPHGGAGTAARRLHHQLVERGIASRFNYWRDETGQKLDSSYRQTEFETPGRLPILGAVSGQLERRRRRTICRLHDHHVANRPGPHELFSIPWSLERTSFDFHTLGTDVVHLHWMSFFIDYASFFGSIPDRFPIVWSLHDMNPLTGGCHYSDGCSRFTVGCGNCHQIASPGERDASWHAFREKRRALRNKHIHVVTPNRWLSDLARHSPIFPPGTEFHLIRLGLDETVFFPVDQRAARRQLGVPPDRPLIAFGAEDIGNHRKGFHHLLAALRRVRRFLPDIECLVFGNGKLPDSRGDLPVFHEFGYVDDADRQRLIYSAADLFVLPSREDNQPQTALESMACGTPVVAFRAGGIPEFVVDGETGLIAPLGDETAMALCIEKLICEPALRAALGRNGRRAVEQNHTAARQAAEYMELYDKIIDQSLPIERQSPGRGLPLTATRGLANSPLTPALSHNVDWER